MARSSPRTSYSHANDPTMKPAFEGREASEARGMAWATVPSGACLRLLGSINGSASAKHWGGGSSGAVVGAIFCAIVFHHGEWMWRMSQTSVPAESVTVFDYPAPAIFMFSSSFGSFGYQDFQCGRFLRASLSNASAAGVFEFTGGFRVPSGPYSQGRLRRPRAFPVDFNRGRNQFVREENPRVVGPCSGYSA